MPLPPSPKSRSTPPPLPIPPLVLHAAPLAVRDAEEATAAVASRAHAAARRSSMFEPKAERERGEFSLLFLSLSLSTCETEKKSDHEKITLALFLLSNWVDAIRRRRGFQDTQKQIPKQQDYVTLFFVLDCFGCCSCCEQASELSVGFNVVGVVVGVVVWPMLSVASSSPPFAHLFAASASAIWQRTASLFFAASDSNDRIVVLEPAAAATAAAEAQCKVVVVVVVVDRDDAKFIVCGLRHGVCVVFSFNFRSSSSSR